MRVKLTSQNMKFIQLALTLSILGISLANKRAEVTCGFHSKTQNGNAYSLRAMMAPCKYILKAKKFEDRLRD